MSGVFVAGDVRKGSVKRLTAAVGEGTMAIQFIHRYCTTAVQRKETPSRSAPSRDPAPATSSSASTT